MNTALQGTVEVTCCLVVLKEESEGRDVEAVPHQKEWGRMRLKQKYYGMPHMRTICTVCDAAGCAD